MDLKEVVITSIANVTTVYSPKGRAVEMRDRLCYGLSLCIDGQITYVQDGKEYVSDRDHVVILPQGQNYSVRGDKTGRFPVINFFCMKPLCSKVTVWKLSNREAVLKDYAELERLFLYGGNKPKLFSVFYELLHKLTANDVPPELKGALRLLQTAYNDPTLTNARLARECNVSEVYFRKLFVRHFKVSPKQYLIDVRLQNAKQLLLEGALNVSAIAESCGFSNPYHFCRLFKQHTGSTPSEYRKANLICEI
ncbi:MAG: helix-turn-helix transcriptional regulator [Clostridia bacterium]|nr:helix-turn-helix transcriptional regulator [Clostridia bacterium]